MSLPDQVLRGGDLSVRLGSLQVAVVVAVLIAVLFALERLLPVRRAKSRLLARLLVNVGASVFALTVASVLIRPLVQRLFALGAEEPFGLLHLVRMPSWAGLTLGFLLMDLTVFYWHVANHRFGFLWRFHNVHHIDPDLDVSTGLRFHFGEIALSAALRVTQVGLLGIAPLTYAIYELCFQANTYFHHSNVRLPIGLERVLNLVLVTPRMHGIHHSRVRCETDSNYGVLLPWWDRLHRTLRLNVPQSCLQIGVPAYSGDRDNDFLSVLTLPFRRQREYWRGPDGRPVERDRSELVGKITRMAE